MIAPLAYMQWTFKNSYITQDVKIRDIRQSNGECYLQGGGSWAITILLAGVNQDKDW